MRYLVIAMLIAIVVSLGSALWSMLRPGKDPKAMVKALAVRVGLSITLFVILMAGYYFGFITSRL
jgi:uncharacterized RDD family membrane protein YckC